MNFDLEQEAPFMTKRVDVAIAIANRVFDGLNVGSACENQQRAAKIEATGRITAQILANEELVIKNV